MTIDRLTKAILAFAASLIVLFSLLSAWKLLWVETVEIAGLTLLSSGLIAASLSRFFSARTCVWLKSVAGLSVAGVICVITVSRSAEILGRYTSDDYIGVRQMNSVFLENLKGKWWVYGGDLDAIRYHRVLTDQPFFSGLEVGKIVHGEKIGISPRLTPVQFRALSAFSKIKFWYGGYYHEMYTVGHDDRSLVYFFILPPSEVKPLTIVLSSEAYSQMKSNAE